MQVLSTLVLVANLHSPFTDFITREGKEGEKIDNPQLQMMSRRFVHAKLSSVLSVELLYPPQ
jgi:hypothetical protein